jgi:hypothetical protein
VLQRAERTRNFSFVFLSRRWKFICV